MITQIALSAIAKEHNDHIRTSVSQNTNQIPERETIKHTLIGSPKAVTRTIYYLQTLGYAEVGAWSPLVPTANRGEFMSVLIRSISVQ